VKVSDDPESMSDADVIYVLRMQHERMEPGQNFVPTLREYARTWGVNSRRVKPGQVVMHPGPMNRGVEIAPDVADSGVSLVEDQVEAGLIVRMAVLYDLMNRPSIGTVIDFRERTGEWGAA
jgi:aspartate carbamoyltransferase catalytic subunit